MTKGDKLTKKIFERILEDGCMDKNPRPHYEDEYVGAVYDPDTNTIITADNEVIELQPNQTAHPQKDKVVFIDSAQNMKVADVLGNVSDITKTEYISQAGSTFPKEQILAATPTYTWHSQPKFIDDNTIVYVSELPYFRNSGQKKYVWIYDAVNNIHKTVWNFVGTDIVIGDVIPDKGITITADGAVYYLNANEEISQ